ncbi:unnamed protein product [Closterium sp. NIES-54]
MQLRFRIAPASGMSATVAEAAAARVAAAEAAGITLSAEVKRALLAGRPVVALESTIICHGTPRFSAVQQQCAASLSESDTANPAVLRVDF